MNGLAACLPSLDRGAFRMGQVRLSARFVAALAALGADPDDVVGPVLEEHAALTYVDTGFDWVSEHEFYRLVNRDDGQPYADLGVLSVLAVTSPDHRETQVLLAQEWEAA